MPPVVGAFVRGCLEKDPRERVRDIGDVRLAMKGAFDVAGTTPSELTVASHLSVWRRLVSIAAVALTALAVGAVAVWSVTRPAPPRVARFAVSLSDEITVVNNSRDVAVSPDGEYIAFVTGGNAGAGGEQLHLRA